MNAPQDRPLPFARVFFALMLGRELGASVLFPVREVLGQAPGHHLRLYRPEDLHLTLVFLGPVPRARLDELRRSVPEHLPRGISLDLALGAAGAFPNRHQPRVLWLALGERRRGALEDLARLREAVARTCRRLGFELDPRPFAPHLTVARLRGGARPPASYFELAEDRPWRPERLALVETVTGAGQSAFRVLDDWTWIGGS